MRMPSISTNGIKLLNKIDKIVVFAFLSTTAYVRIIDNSAFVLAICSACLFVSGFWNLFQIVRNKESNIIAVIALYILFWIIEVICRPTWVYDIRFLVSSISYFGIAYSFMTNKRRILPYLVLYYGIALYLVIQILVFRVSYRTIMKEGSSYNYISILVLFYLLILHYLQMKEGKELSYIPGVIFLVVSVLCYGRGGIVAAGIYNAALLTVKGIVHKRQFKTFVIGFIFIVFLIVVGRIVIEKLLEQGYLNKFLNYGMDNNGRSMVWSQFISTCTESVWNFLVGGDPRILEYIEFNVHNSFLQLYASFGFLPFIIVMSLFVYRILLFGLRRNYWMLVIIVGFIARAMTDKLMYRGYHEIVFYIILFEDHIRNGISKKNDKYKMLMKGYENV